MAKVIDVPEPVKLNGKDDFKFAEFLEAALDMYEPLGKGIKSIKQAVKIHTILEAMNGEKTLRLEDADFEVVKAAVDAGKWLPKAARLMLPYFEALEAPQNVKV